MHRLPSQYIIWRFRIASMVVVFMTLGLIPASGVLGYGIVTKDHFWIAAGGACFLGLLVLLILNFIMTARLRCPLCMVPPLQNRRCSKHRTCKRLFGSHRLKVATSILTEGSFACPYCGEMTAMQIRSRGR